MHHSHRSLPPVTSTATPRPETITMFNQRASRQQGKRGTKSTRSTTGTPSVFRKVGKCSHHANAMLSLTNEPADASHYSASSALVGFFRDSVCGSYSCHISVQRLSNPKITRQRPKNHVADLYLPWSIQIDPIARYRTVIAEERRKI